jgi:hypothetical protein
MAKKNTTTSAKSAKSTQVINTLKVAKDGSNWRQIVNATQPLPFVVEDFLGKTYEVTNYLKAHSQFKGSKTCVTYKHEGVTHKEVETDIFRSLLCPDYKKGEHVQRGKEDPTQKFERLINEALQIKGVPDSLKNAVSEALKNAKEDLEKAVRAARKAALLAELAELED